MWTGTRITPNLPVGLAIQYSIFNFVVDFERPRLHISLAKMIKSLHSGVIFRALERGSSAHIALLENDWPHDIHSSERAMSLVLGHLVASLPLIEDVNSRVARGHTDFPYSGVWGTLSLVRACFNALEGAFSFINNKASEAAVKRMFALITPNAECLVSWCKFLARNPGLVFPERARDHGLHQASSTLANLLKRGASFLAETDTLEKVVDIILWIWTKGTDPYESKGTVLDPSDYEWCASRRNGCISEALNESQPTRNITLKKINAMDREHRRRLAKVFCRRVREWVAVHENLYRENPSQFDGRYLTYLCALAQELSIVESFCRALTNCKFWHLLIATALRFSNAPSPTACIEAGSLGTEVAYNLFLPPRDSAYEIFQTMPQCLEAGMFELFVDDLLRSQTRNCSRFAWNDKEVADPFSRLYTLSHHPRLNRTVVSAVGALPAEKVAAVRSDPVAAAAFKSLARNLEDFEEGSEHHDGTLFCACLLHEQISPRAVRPLEPQSTSHAHAKQGVPTANSASGASPDIDINPRPKLPAKECSGCCDVVYCSLECQKQDWEAFHRYECPRSRADRFRLQRAGFPMSHQIRKFYLLNLASNVTSLNAAGRPEEHRCCCEPEKNPAYFIDLRDMPLHWSVMEANATLEWSDEDLIRKGAPGPVPIFDDARFRAMVDASNTRQDVHVACSISLLGNYLVATMGRFAFSGGFGSSFGEEAELHCHGPRNINLLGGTVKVVELEK